MTTLEQFMAGTPRAMDGSSPWASKYARELRGVITRHAASAPRSLQQRLGPSELGEVCSRSVVAKLAGEPRTNHVSDPWPSIVGTAVHAWLANAFRAENQREGVLRWVTEAAVEPAPGYGGHADLYDAEEQCVCDHKVLGATSLAKIKSDGPSRKYRVQLVLYGMGFRALGLPVKRVVLAAYPRTASSLDGMYIWDHALSPADDELAAEVLRQAAVRQEVSNLVRAGAMSLMQVPATPGDSCFYCPVYRSQAAYDGGPGCPGTLLPGAR